ncbi:MAG: SGNH/GDSL hydrolase family protein [Candidatus Hydrogenedentota bacterium]
MIVKLIVIILITAVIFEIIFRVRRYVTHTPRDARALLSLYNEERDKAIQYFKDEYKLQFDIDPYLFIKLKPNQKYKTIRINSLGFRDDEISEKKSLNEYRVLFLGGSSAWGVGSIDNKITLPKILENKLNSTYADKKHTVINAACPGYVSDQELILLLRMLDRYKIDLVIDFNGFNDFYTLYKNPPGYPCHYSRMYAIYKLLAPIKRIIGSSELLYYLNENIIKPFITVDIASITITKIEDAAVHYVNNCLTMSLLAKSRGIDVVIVLQPIVGSKKVKTEEEKNNMTSNEIELANKIYARYREYFNKLSLNDNLSFLDLSNVFDNETRTIFIDRAHFTGKDTETLADNILKTIKDKKLTVKSNYRIPIT